MSQKTIVVYGSDRIQNPDAPVQPSAHVSGCQCPECKQVIAQQEARNSVPLRVKSKYARGVIVEVSDSLLSRLGANAANFEEKLIAFAKKPIASATPKPKPPLADSGAKTKPAPSAGEANPPSSAQPGEPNYRSEWITSAALHRDFPTAESYAAFRRWNISQHVPGAQQSFDPMTFGAAIQMFEASGLSRGQAIQRAVSEYPGLHLVWLSGDRKLPAPYHTRVPSTFQDAVSMLVEEGSSVAAAVRQATHEFSHLRAEYDGSPIDTRKAELKRDSIAATHRPQPNESALPIGGGYLNE